MAVLSKRTIVLGSVTTAFAVIFYLINSLDNPASSIGTSPVFQKRDSGGGFPEPSCPDYSVYSTQSHEPLSKGPLKLPYQRPQDNCRTFKSELVDKTIDEYTSRMSSPDLARLFENCFPNTLDTTIRWHSPDSNGSGPKTFVITGDKNAEWLRDSRNQLYSYMKLAPFDKDLRVLLQGAINLQADFININPYCNAYQPPPESNLSPEKTGDDNVNPPVNTDQIYHCQFEVDSVAAFFALTNDYYSATGDSSVVNDNWVKAANSLLDVIKEMQTPTFFGEYDELNNVTYTFNRQTDNSLATTDLGGHGNPMAQDTNLLRTFSRPSDDFGFLPIMIPANAMLSVELKKAGKLLAKTKDQQDLGKQFTQIGEAIEAGVKEHGTFEHKKYGKVYAYEIDGFGSLMSMDDANLPSLLQLPDLGFCDIDDETYQNTRKMILDQRSNPYYMEGKYFSGIGGPHVGTQNAWPMANAVRIRTSDDDDEIREQLKILENSTAGLGLMHESVNVNLPITNSTDSYSRPWFAWMNTEFARTIIDLAERKPYLIFKTDTKFSLQEVGKNETAKST